MCDDKFCGHRFKFLPVFKSVQYVGNIFMIVAQALIII